MDLFEIVGEAEMSGDEVRCAPVSGGEMRCVTCCRLEALVSVDERGQMILPKEVREKAEIKAGEKLVVASCEKEGKISCIFLMKAEEFKESLKKTLGPLLEELLR